MNTQDQQNPQDTVSSKTVEVTGYIPCTEHDERCVGSFTSNDGQGLCYLREIIVTIEEEK